MFHLLFFNRFTLDQFLATLTGLSVHTSDLLPYEEGFKNQLIESGLSSHKPQPAAAVDIWAATRESAATAPALLLVSLCFRAGGMGGNWKEARKASRLGCL